MVLESSLSMRIVTASKQGRVLVLVREQRLHQLLLLVLSQVGYTPLGCSTLTEAKQVLVQHSPPKLILYDGAETSEERLHEQVRQLGLSIPGGVKCRLIVFSLSHPQPRLPALPGVDIIIARPFDLTHLLDKVDALMQG